MQISDELAAKKIFEKIKGTPDLNVPKVEQYVQKYIGMVGKAPTDVKYLTALVVGHLQDMGVMSENEEGVNKKPEDDMAMDDTSMELGDESTSDELSVEDEPTEELPSDDVEMDDDLSDDDEPMDEKKSLLKDLIMAMISGDTEAATTALSQYMDLKGSDVVHDNVDEVPDVDADEMTADDSVPSDDVEGLDLDDDLGQEGQDDLSLDKDIK